MTPCVYCIGCKHYQREEIDWCELDEECERREKWEAREDDEE